MKRFIHAFAALLSVVPAVLAQNYQTQYPYDPYSGSPQPQAQQPYTGGYEAYNAPAGDYSGGGYGSGGSQYRMLTWGQLEGNFAFNDFKGDDDLDGSSGFGVDLRVSLMKVLYLHFGLDRITADAPHARSLEVNTYVAGAGAYLPLGSRFQLYGEAGLRYDDVGDDWEDFNSDDLGVYIRPGIRFAITEKWELTASVLFNDTENFNNHVIEVSTYYSLLSWLDIGAGVDFGDDVNSYRIGGRWRWD